MGVQRRLPVNRNRLAEWLDDLLGRMPQTDGVVRHDDGETFLLHVALPGIELCEIAVGIAPDHVVVDAAADLHLLLPFPETIDPARSAAWLRRGVLTVRAPRDGSR